MPQDDKSTPWWQSIPATITALTTFVAAVSGLVVAFNHVGFFSSKRAEPAATLPVQSLPLPAPTVVPNPPAAMPSTDAAREGDLERAREGRQITLARAEEARESQERAREQGARKAAQADLGSAQLSGIWSEVDPQNPARGMSLEVQQNGAEVTIRSGHNGVFDVSMGQAIVHDGTASWTLPQNPCGRKYQHPGYNYDNPGQHLFSLKLENSILLYQEETTWNAPCANNPIGTRVISKRLRRIGANG